MKILTAAFALVLASTAAADEILLRNGHRVVGIQSEEKDRIIVETGYGTVSYPREEVVSVTKGETPLHAWPVRYAEIEKSTNASDFTKLAAWARENNMPKYVGGLMKRALELDPENAEARAALGFVRRNGRWVQASEARKGTAEKGDPEGDRGLNSLEKQLRERARLESESRKLDRESQRREREERRRRAKEEAAIQASIRAAQSAPIRWDSPTGYRRHSYWGYNLYGYGDLVNVDWVLAYLVSGNIFPITTSIRGVGGVRPTLVPPGSAGSDPGMPVDPPSPAPVPVGP